MSNIRRMGLVLAAWVILSGGASAEEDRPNFADCRPETAWVVPAVDPAPVLRAAPIPPPAAQRLAEIGRKYFDVVGPGWLRGDTCSALYGQIYRWTTPGDHELFGIRLLNLTKWGEYRYFLFDPKTGAVSPTVVRLTLTDWMDEKPERRQSAPDISFADLYGDGQKQIVIPEHKRNGTVYSCLIRHYFNVGDDLSLTRVMALETDALKPLYGPGESVPAYKRRLTILGGNRLRIDTALGSFDPGVKETPMGYAILGSDGRGLPFRVLSRQPRTAEDDWALVEISRRSTLDEEDDDRFLREGCPDC